MSSYAASPLPLPVLTQARAPLVCEVQAVNELGEPQAVAIPAERALTVLLDGRELVTLMTLGALPELLVLGFLLNQRLVASACDVAAVSVDWEAGTAVVHTHAGVADLQARTARRVVTTGCGQGSVFGDLMDNIDQLRLPPGTLSQARLYGIVDAVRAHQSIYKSAGSVHGCALFQGARMQIFVEDVGRHNAVDTIAGWMGMQQPGAADGADQVLYTTGRLTSEMVIKAAQMGVPFAVSRSGITQMGLDVARRLGLCTVGRALNKRFLCYSAPERLLWQPELAGAAALADGA